MSLFRLFILWGQFKGTADLFDQSCKLFWGLRGNSFNVSLENQKVLRLYEDVVRDESSVIRGISDGSAIEFVFGRSCGRNSGQVCRWVDRTSNTMVEYSHPLEKPLLLSVVENCKYPCPLGRGSLFLLFVDLFGWFLWRCGQFPSTVDKVLQLTTSQLGTLDSENERDGVHEV